MKITPLAQKIWDEIPGWAKIKILNAVWCGKCQTSRSMTLESGVKRKHGLVLRGKCITCNGSVCRVVEN